MLKTVSSRAQGVDGDSDQMTAPNRVMESTFGFGAGASDQQIVTHGNIDDAATHLGEELLT